MQRDDGIREKTPGRFEYRIRIPHQIDKFGIGEHFQDFFHLAGMRGILAEKLAALGIPEGDFNQFQECLPEHPVFFGSSCFHGQKPIAIFQHILRQKPEIIIGARHHIG